MKNRIRKINRGYKKALTMLSIILITLGPLGLFILRANASALSFVCASSTRATSTAACSGEQTGDLLIVSAFATQTSTIPTLATGFTNINSASNSGGATSTRTALIAGWSTATSSSSNSGTWTNATDVIMQVYRGQAASPVGNSAVDGGNNSGTLVNYPAVNLTATDNSSWFTGFAGIAAGQALLSTPPTGMINRTSETAPTPRVTGNDTNGPTSSNWPSTDVTGFSTTKFTSIVIEIKAAPTITVGAAGSSVANMTIPSTSDYIGGAFSFIRDVGSANVTSIKLTNVGTTNADTNISNLILFYKQEAVCSASIPSGTTQFNSTGGTFTSNTSTVTGTMNVSTSQICVYAQVDVGSGASSGDTLDLEIANPSTDVTASSGSVAPGTIVSPTGSTTLVPPGPTTDQVMRGGEWFSGGAKQPFFWAQ